MVVQAQYEDEDWDPALDKHCFTKDNGETVCGNPTNNLCMTDGVETDCYDFLPKNINA